MCSSVADVIHEHPHFLMNSAVVHVNVAVALAVLAGPIPDIAIHPLVDLADETLINQIGGSKASRKQPFFRLQDVLLLLAIPFGTIGDLGML